jgi:adenylosuccinate synthase
MTRRWQAHTVVRFSGGGQAGHNVVEPDSVGSGRRHHTFSQFGAGTLVPGVGTVLLDPMLIHPTAILVEAGVLGSIGINDALSRLMIDANCRVTTPYHQAAGRLREILRGQSAHGSCGVGVGETVRHSLEHPEETLTYGDLSAETAERVSRDKLHAIRKSLSLDLLPLCQSVTDPALAAEVSILQDEFVAGKWLGVARALARHCRPATTESIRRHLSQPGCVLFEGAQGVLLDEWRGFHPHTTWSSVTAGAVDRVLAGLGIDKKAEHYGVLRCYLTRHGEGPLPTHDESLDSLIAEPHNSDTCWQGRFRRGHPDAVLMRYAIEAAGGLCGLFISHLDVFQRGIALRWCDRYWHAAGWVERLSMGEAGDLDHQMGLTNLLGGAKPQYADEKIGSEGSFMERMATVTSLPVIHRSYGCSWPDVA